MTRSNRPDANAARLRVVTLRAPEGVIACVARLADVTLSASYPLLVSPRTLRAHAPDVAIVEATRDGAELARWMRLAHEAMPKLRFLVLAPRGSAPFVRDALVAGAHGALCDDASVDVLDEALRTIADGEIWLDRETQCALMAMMRPEKSAANAAA